MKYKGRDLKDSIDKVDLFDWYRRKARKIAKRLFAKSRRRWGKKIIEEGMEQ